MSLKKIQKRKTVVILPMKAHLIFCSQYLESAGNRNSLQTLSAENPITSGILSLKLSRKTKVEGNLRQLQSFLSFQVTDTCQKTKQDLAKGPVARHKNTHCGRETRRRR